MGVVALADPGQRAPLAGRYSDAGCEQVERDPETAEGWFVGGDFVVAAAQVLHEGVPYCQGLS